MFIGLISQGNASREYYGYVDKVFTCLFSHLSTKYLAIAGASGFFNKWCGTRRSTKGPLRYTVRWFVTGQCIYL